MPGKLTFQTFVVRKSGGCRRAVTSGPFCEEWLTVSGASIVRCMAARRSCLGHEFQEDLLLRELCGRCYWGEKWVQTISLKWWSWEFCFCPKWSFLLEENVCRNWHVCFVKWVLYNYHLLLVLRVVVTLMYLPHAKIFWGNDYWQYSQLFFMSTNVYYIYHPLQRLNTFSLCKFLTSLP